MPYSTDETPLKIALPDFPWLLPLREGLRQQEEVHLIHDDPVALARALDTGDLDALLTPPLEAFGRLGAYVIPGLGFSLKEPPSPLELHHQGALQDLKRIYLDPSITSYTKLLDLLIREMGAADFSLIPAPSQRVLLTDQEGHAAFSIEPSEESATAGDASRLDLAAWWRDRFDAPLVLLIWQGRFRAPYPRLRRVLLQAHRAMDLQLGDGLETAKQQASCPESSLRFLASLGHQIASAESESLRALLALAKKHGYCDVQAELSFC